ncbi:MAG: diacylglycerol/lipid kinase family protein [Candidatus Scalinduaceae bacterium]
MQKKLLIILNPIAGKGISKELVHKTLGFFKDRDYVIDFCETKRRGDARKAVQRLNDDDYKIIIMGGDGTFNEVINGLRNWKIRIGIIPTGTANVLAKELKIPFDIINACEVIAQENELKLDLGRNEKGYFALLGGVGLDAMVVKDLSLRRVGNISYFSYAIPIIKNLLNYKYPKLSVEIDGKLIEKNAGLVFIGNTKSYAGPIEVTSYAKVNDGIFDVCIIKMKRRLSILRHILKAFMRTLPESEDVRYIKGKIVSVTSDLHVPYQIDGEFAGYVPTMFEIIPKAVPVIVPRSILN